MPLSQGYGSTLSFSSGFFGKIQSISIDGPNREPLDVTHLLSPGNAMEFIPSTLIDSGEVTVVCFDTGGTPPITSAAETVTIALSTGRSVACSGFLTTSQTTADVKGVVMTTSKIKFTGPTS